MDDDDELASSSELTDDGNSEEDSEEELPVESPLVATMLADGRLSFVSSPSDRVRLYRMEQPLAFPYPPAGSRLVVKRVDIDRSIPDDADRTRAVYELFAKQRWCPPVYYCETTSDHVFVFMAWGQTPVALQTPKLLPIYDEMYRWGWMHTQIFEAHVVVLDDQRWVLISLDHKCVNRRAVEQKSTYAVSIEQRYSLEDQ